MLSGLCVDYGGVLTTPVADSFASFCETEAIDAEVFRSVVIGAARTPDSPFARVETGAISQEEFDASLAALLSGACGKGIDATGLKQRLFAAIRQDEAMVRAIAAARRAGVKTALVSNSWGGRDYPLDVLDELFDEVVISGEIGMRKPEPDIYRFAAGKLGLRESDCAFVDDLRTNVEGANAVGMTGVLHVEAHETIAKLAELLGVALR